MTSKSLFTLLFILCISCYHAPTNTIRYPDTSKNHKISDTYFGTTVTDPYRWLEDDNSPETAQWVKEQNNITFQYLQQISVSLFLIVSR